MMSEIDKKLEANTSVLLSLDLSGSPKENKLANICAFCKSFIFLGSQKFPHVQIIMRARKSRHSG
jgi:hypothetical protein